MSVNYTIDQLIAVSQGSLAEMRMAGEGLGKAISITPAAIARRQPELARHGAHFQV